jgi:multiple sugar transport system ATP-binding protein
LIYEKAIAFVATVTLDRIEKTFPVRQARTGDHTGVTVLHNINLNIADGEFLVLVGPSGCGKSTLLRLIAGLESPTAGDIWLNDRHLNPLPPKARDIAMVFQSYALYPHLTVFDNLAFGLRRTPWQHVEVATAGTSAKSASEAALRSSWPGWLDRTLVGATRVLPKSWRYSSPREQAVQKQVHYVAQMLQLEHLLKRLPKQLSGGQKQRVALGRAIARNPQVFLMDEPLSNLDAQLRTETRAQIANLQRELGITTIYVTHDQTEAMTMGHRIAVMSEGKIQQIASPLELYNKPANRFVAEFIGSPTMNFLAVTVTAPLTLQHPQFCLTLPEYWGDRLAAYQNQSLWLGVRPEHLHLGSKSSPDLASTALSQGLTVEVERVEALGSETYLICKDLTADMSNNLSNSGHARIQVRTTPDYCPGWGEKLQLAIAIDKIHLFEAHSGATIPAPAASL